jgi:sec-independent protein translocase protein TatA
VSLGPAEVLVILLVALLVFGPSKLPEIGRQVGRGLREFRKFQESLRDEMGDVFATDAREEAAPAPSLPPKAADDVIDVEAGAPDDVRQGESRPPNPSGTTA